MILNKRNPETLETISTLISDGGVAILPCDTIYGLCAAYEIGEKALMDLKGRDSSKPFLILATIEQAKQRNNIMNTVIGKRMKKSEFVAFGRRFFHCRIQHKMEDPECKEDTHRYTVKP